MQLRFFSTNISDFWRKWHISLTTWMMDYIFTPLSFILRGYGKIGLSISIVFTFLFVGLWHGGNWTFVIYGLLQGLYFIPLIAKGTINKSTIVADGKFLPSLKEFFQMLALFSLLMFTLIIFRAESAKYALLYLKGIFTMSLLSFPKGTPKYLFILILIFQLAEWLQRSKLHALDFDSIKIPRVMRRTIYYVVIFIIFYYGAEDQEFIYFQF